MRIGNATGPSHEANNGTKLRVCDEAAIRELHAARHADIAAIVRLATSRANAAFEAVARRAPWHLYIIVVHDIEIRVCRGDQCLTRIARGCWNLAPVFGWR